MKYFSLLFIVFFFSCNKWGKGYVEGHVYENGTTEPVANAKVKLFSSHYGNQGYVLGDVKSDANGYFKISYHNALSGSWSYQVTVSNPEGWPSGQKKDISNRKEKIEFYFDPIAYVRFRIKNNTPNNFSLGFFSDDNPAVLGINGLGNTDQIYPDLLEVNGNGTTKISWNYLSNTYSDNVTIYHKKDTLIYLITLN